MEGARLSDSESSRSVVYDGTAGARPDGVGSNFTQPESSK